MRERGIPTDFSTVFRKIEAQSAKRQSQQGATRGLGAAFAKGESNRLQRDVLWLGEETLEQHGPWRRGDQQRVAVIEVQGVLSELSGAHASERNAGGSARTNDVSILVVLATAQDDRRRRTSARNLDEAFANAQTHAGGDRFGADVIHRAIHDPKNRVGPCTSRRNGPDDFLKVRDELRGMRGVAREVGHDEQRVVVAELHGIAVTRLRRCVLDDINVERGGAGAGVGVWP
jgi:hypothetical protein